MPAVGKVTQVIGPVVDVEFPSGRLPRILNALTVTNPSVSDEKDNVVYIELVPEITLEPDYHKAEQALLK